MLNYKTGVVGAGRVGAGMATLMAGHGCSVTIIGLDEDDLKRCRGILEGNLDELVQQGLATEKNRAAILKRFTLSTDTADLKDCMFVLEAAFENLDVKKASTSRLRPLFHRIRSWRRPPRPFRSSC